MHTELTYWLRLVHYIQERPIHMLKMISPPPTWFQKSDDSISGMGGFFVVPMVNPSFGATFFRRTSLIALCLITIPLAYMVITRSLLPLNSGNLPLPFFLVITLLFSCKIFIADCICILTGSPWYYLFMILYVIRKIEVNENSTYSINVMADYHYNGKNRVITQ